MIRWKTFIFKFRRFTSKITSHFSKWEIRKFILLIVNYSIRTSNIVSDTAEEPVIKLHIYICRGTSDQIANILWIIQRAREFQKNIYFCFIDYVKAFDCVNHNKCEKLLKMVISRPSYLSPKKPVCLSGSKLEPCMEQRTSSRLRKEYGKAVYCYPVYLTYMQSTSCEMLSWMSYKLESRLPGEI